MTFKYIFTKPKPQNQKIVALQQSTHVMRTYFDATWELWRREVNRVLWDWAVDGPFCKDKKCSQRMTPVHGKKNSWVCIRCGSHSKLPKVDYIILRGLVIQNFEEEKHQKKASLSKLKIFKSKTATQVAVF